MMKAIQNKPKPSHPFIEACVAHLPVIGFAVCVIAGWIAMALGSWWWMGLGIGVGLLVGDLLDDITRSRHGGRGDPGNQ